ncbi:Josephin domain-containing protein [Mycena venus]|uniref:ubiquitinyl hydrolase 1 n=1 Tax=Mycena venus TaxID=2733690 RepID=A0A8H7D756_9AGAR|nr:Josephin domain-containing protein [Mycena venus]
MELTVYLGGGGKKCGPFMTTRSATQLAFILNYEQHWFTLRRFGPHWFNLNSFIKPEWISKLYLGMVLQQAEADGYSVFAVTPADPSSTPGLPHTEADDLASTIPEPNSMSRPNPHSFTSHGAGGSNQPEFIEGMEDEDYELQAVLQASLMGDASPTVPPPVVRNSVPLPPSGSESPSSSSRYATPLDSVQDVPSDLDPVAATMERNRLLLERMKAEQEYAQRQLWADEESRGTRERDTEEEMIRRAIEESEASARLEGHGTGGESSSPAETSMEGIVQSHPSHFGQERVYDDDDAELQAALKASLEQLPEGWTLPEPVPHQESIHPNIAVSQRSGSVEPSDAPSPPPPEEEVSVDELRRRRLARFGS